MLELYYCLVFGVGKKGLSSGGHEVEVAKWNGTKCIMSVYFTSNSFVYG